MHQFITEPTRRLTAWKTAATWVKPFQNPAAQKAASATQMQKSQNTSPEAGHVEGSGGDRADPEAGHAEGSGGNTVPQDVHDGSLEDSRRC